MLCETRVAVVRAAGGNGSGRIWVVPTDALPAMSHDGLTLDHNWVRRPPGAVPLMQAIEGNGSPWSYLSASIPYLPTWGRHGMEKTLV